jgi:hypothetical protein
VSGKAFVVAATGLSTLLVVAYLAAGGGSYEPTPVADPCQSRVWTSPDDLQEDAQQFFLSALDGAACELGVSREELAAALATEDSRQRFASELGIDDLKLEFAIRAGVGRAIDDAQQAGALSPLVATGLRALANRLPVEEVIALVGGAQDAFSGGGVLGNLGGLLDQAGGLLP